MRIEYENLNAVSNQLEAFKKTGTAPEEWTPYLLASIATSLAQIADALVEKVENEPHERRDKE